MQEAYGRTLPLAQDSLMMAKGGQAGWWNADLAPLPTPAP